MSALEDGKLSYNINEAAHAVGISRSTLYADIRDGLVSAGWLRGRRVIEAAELARYFRENFQPDKVRSAA
jgi:predicted site-specific integrase-resolvase